MAIPPEVNQYAAAIQRVLVGTAEPSLESAFLLGMKAAEALQRFSGPPNDPALVLESLDEAAYAQAVEEMQGFLLSREEIILAEPDAEFFLKLAKEKGTAADLAFFTLYKKTRPESVLRVYWEPHTDFSACTVYGKGLLADLPKAPLAEKISRRAADIRKDPSIIRANCSPG